MQNLNANLKPYNKIRVNLKTDNNANINNTNINNTNNKINENNSPKYFDSKTNNVIKKPILAKNINYNNSNNNINKSNEKKNCILKINEIKKNIFNEVEQKLINSFSVKREKENETFINSYSDSNSKSSNNKIQYQIYYSNEGKSNNSNTSPSSQYGNILNSNIKNICLKPNGIWLKNRTKKLSKNKSSNNPSKGKNLTKEKATYINNKNNNNKNIINRNINKSDIYNKKKIINNSTQRNNFKNYIFKELFPIEENDIFDIKCHFNTKQLKNKILLLNEGCISNNKCNSPKECYSFNDSALSPICHSDLNIINKTNMSEDKIKQNFSNIYNKKKNLIIKTDQNLSGEKMISPQSTDKKIKYIYKSKLSLY